MSVVIETTIGDITIDLYIEERPRTCMNFLKLCKTKYYNFNLLFSVERNFIFQTGDPSGTGREGESIYRRLYGEQARFFEGEKKPIKKHKSMGTVSMVSCGKHMFGSQFLITLGENLDSLDDEHLVFGYVVEGEEVLNILNNTLTNDKHRPYQDIRITHTVILDDPYPDPDGLIMPDSSPIPTKEMMESDYIGAEENINDTEGKSMEQIQEEIKVQEAEERATILEIVGDLPDATVAPPENILFVCKLNNVTTSEDLEIIFSRFGKINSCEVIQDKITGNSLQYAFVEFDNRKSCENAYFKMDNVLIDERRIHVDFSQSVSKIQWKGKGKIEYFDEEGRKVDDKSNKKFNPNKNSVRTGKSNERHHHPVDKEQFTPKSNSNNRFIALEKNGQRDFHHRDNVRREEKIKNFNSNKSKDDAIDRDELCDRGVKRPHTNDIEDLANSKKSREKILKHLKKELKKKKKRKDSCSSNSDVKSKHKSKKGKPKKSKHTDSDQEKKSKRKKTEHTSDDSDSLHKKAKKKKKKKKRTKAKSDSNSD